MSIDIEELKLQKNPPKKQKTTVPEKEENLSIKYYKVDLPSGGKMGYPETIEYRDIMLRDEKIISTATEKNFQTVINDVLKSLLKEKDFFSKLCIYDRDFLILWIWTNSYGTTRNLNHSCVHCDAENKISVDLTKMKVDDLSDDYQHPYPVTLSSGETVRFKLLSVGDESLTQQHCALNKTLEETTVLLSRSVMFDKVMDMDEKLKHMDDTFSGKDMAKLRGFHSKFKFGADDRHEYACSSCGGVNKIRIPFRIEDFLPTNYSDFE